jgi:hypothetical protein
MVTQIGEKDRFGYDDNGRPVAAQIAHGVVVLGYTFCARLKAATEAGLQDGYHLFADRPAALICLFSPTAEAAELWSGTWTRQHASGDSYNYNITDPQYLGVIQKRFPDLQSVTEFIKSGTPVAIGPAYLTVSGIEMIPIPDVVADRELALRIRKTPQRFSASKVDLSRLPDSERNVAADIDYLIQGLYTYVFRIDAAAKLTTYANTLHFSRPQLLPHSDSKFFISMEWRQMAGRDAAMSLFHFQRTLEALRQKALREGTTLRKGVDFGKLRIAWKLYDSQFKDVVRMRHTVGHEAEFYSSLEARTLHSGNPNVFVEFLMTDSTLSMSSHGRLVSVEVSQKTVDKLERIKTLVVEAFSGVMRTV